MTPALVTLTTDFGTRDPYVAAMKGVLLRGCPEVTVVDLTHEIAPQNLVEATLFLDAALPEFPAGAVHVAVVDPGVGTTRRPLAARAGGHTLVFPDNGLCSLFFRRTPPEAVHVIERCPLFPQRRGATFHGRDVFAPAAAWLALGNPVESLGPPAEERPLRLYLPEPAKDASGRMSGEVLHVDRFGNAVTNLPGGEELRGTVVVELPGDPVRIPVRRTYGDADPGGLVAVTGSTGRLEVALRDGSAARRLGLGTGAKVSFVPERE
ncbi:MAG: SAM-dependent chlorinase/fluorinase [Candidatus Hydrogenedentes bacterium]|nr:SAM-dependent chlorinase/fluorinase [Candidatus Hydrogenedentota bacterium]